MGALVAEDPSDKAAMHRRRHAASVVSHGFVAVSSYRSRGGKGSWVI
jgi:hypothetical protein